MPNGALSIHNRGLPYAFKILTPNQNTTLTLVLTQSPPYIPQRAPADVDSDHDHDLVTLLILMLTLTLTS